MKDWARVWENIIARVRRPSRYVGREVNARSSTSFEEASLKICLIFPDLYEIGMSHIGLHLLYLILKERPGYFVDRAYAPARDLEAILRQEKVPLLSLEAKRPLKDFDVLGISYPYELCATNIVNILDLAGLPALAKDRPAPFPLILGGGSAVANPEPVAPFYDAIIIGEAEEAILEIAETVRQAKEGGATKEELLEALSAIEGVYVPSFFEPIYQGETFVGLKPLKPGYEKIKRRILPQLDQVPYPYRPPVPWAEITHDRLAIEISRGCTRGCRFCQASSIYRPVRERPLERILALAEEGLAATGWDEVSFLSLSAGDYSCLTELIVAFNRRFLPEKVALSLPSLRVGSLNQTIIKEIKKVRKTGFTLAPEAGTERLRRVINKDISEEALWETARLAFEAGWRHLKLYFMIGLPTETPEDLEGIVSLARRLTRIKGKMGPQVNVSVSTFIPKPHTAFQWEEQINLAETEARLSFLRARLKGRKLRFKWHKPEQSFLEGVFSRGDRRLADLIYLAFQLGARLDGWSDELRFDLWRTAAQKLGLDLERYLSARAPSAPLPWDHIDLGVTKEFLLQEREKALGQEVSPDCRWARCLKCGVCDFKRVKNQLVKECKLPPIVSVSREEEEGRFTYRLVYQKIGWARFLSQLEVMRAFHRAVRRARLPVSFSEGFHPLPRLSFARALPVGVESHYEVAALELRRRLTPREVKERLNEVLVPELAVKEVRFSSPEAALKLPEEVTYEIILPAPVTQEQVAAFLAQRSVTLVVRRGKKEKEIEIRPYVVSLTLKEPQVLELVLFEPAQGGVRAEEVVAALLGTTEGVRIIKQAPSSEPFEQPFEGLAHEL